MTCEHLLRSPDLQERDGNERIDDPRKDAGRIHALF